VTARSVRTPALKLTELRLDIPEFDYRHTPVSFSAFRLRRRPDDHRDERVRENGNQDDVHDYESNDEEHDRKMNVSRDRSAKKTTSALSCTASDRRPVSTAEEAVADHARYTSATAL